MTDKEKIIGPLRPAEDIRRENLEKEGRESVMVRHQGVVAQQQASQKGQPVTAGGGYNPQRAIARFNRAKRAICATPCDYAKRCSTCGNNRTLTKRCRFPKCCIC